MDKLEDKLEIVSLNKKRKEGVEMAKYGEKLTERVVSRY